MNTRRAAGLSLLVYGVGSIGAFIALGSPGGDYSSAVVRSYVDRSHWLIAFVAAYAGIASALALLPLGRAMVGLGGRRGELLGSLSVAAVAVAVVGWFVDAGVDVSMAEGGVAVRDGVPHPVVYMLTETANLLAVFAPALFVGVAAVVLAFTVPMPGWLRAFSVVAGVCGVLAPLYFTMIVFVLWTLVAGVALATTRATADVPLELTEAA